MSNYSLWTTNATSSAPIVTGPIDFSGEFTTLYQDPTRSSWTVNTQYLMHVSYRPSIGYVRVWIKDPSGTIVQDSGSIWDTGAITTVSMC